MPPDVFGKPDWQVKSEYIAAEDENAAIRNAFGGNRRELFTGVMSALPPLSRKVWDDVAVQVVFFNDLDKLH